MRQASASNMSITRARTTICRHLRLRPIDKPATTIVSPPSSSSAFSLHWLVAVWRAPGKQDGKGRTTVGGPEQRLNRHLAQQVLALCTELRGPSVRRMTSLAQREAALAMDSSCGHSS